MGIKIILAVPLAALAFSATSSQAAVGSAGEFPSEAVSYAGLDLASPVGIERLDRRIRKAAGRVCGGQPQLALPNRRMYRLCVDETTARAQWQRNRAIASFEANRGTQLASR